MLTSKQLLPLIAYSSLATAQVQLQFASCGPCDSPIAVLQLSNGNRLLVGSREVLSSAGLSYYTGAKHKQILLTTVGPAPFGVSPVGGSGNDIPAAAEVDPPAIFGSWEAPIRMISSW